jgi:hypothetical protein
LVGIEAEAAANLLPAQQQPLLLLHLPALLMLAAQVHQHQQQHQMIQLPCVVGQCLLADHAAQCMLCNGCQMER